MSAPHRVPLAPFARRRVARGREKIGRVDDAGAREKREGEGDVGETREGDAWTRLRTTRDGIELWTRPAPAWAKARGRVREILATCTFENVERGALWTAICDIERYDEFVPYVRRSTVLARRGTRTWNHAEIRAPVAGDRVYTIVIDDHSRANVNAGAWRTTKEMEPRRLKPGARRMRANCGSWELRDGASGAGVRVRYTLITDPGAGVPQWLLSQTPKTVPDTLRAFRDRALSGASETRVANSSTRDLRARCRAFAGRRFERCERESRVLVARLRAALDGVKLNRVE